MTTISNTISTQTTTFLEKCPSVLQRKEIRSAFFKKMERAFSKKVVSINKTNKINSKQAAQNKKTLLKIVREMTLNIRKERILQSKAEKIDRLAAKEIAQAEKELANGFKIDRLAAKEIAKAEREAEKEAKEAEKIDRLAVKEISEVEKELNIAEKIDRLAVKEILQAEKEAEKEAKEAEKIVRLAAKEIAKAEKEAKKDMAVRMAWEKMVQRMAIDAPGAVFVQRTLVVEVD
jgi:hypothetical protein